MAPRVGIALALIVASGCANRPGPGPGTATDAPGFVQVTTSMKATTIARLGRDAFARCEGYRKRLDPSPGDRVCRWAYLYTAIACERDQPASCVLAGRLASASYGKDSEVARDHFQSACERGIKAACALLKEPPREFAKPPPPLPSRRSAAGCIDEIACLLSSNPPPCCQRYLPQPTVRRGRLLTGLGLQRLSRLHIKLGMMRVARDVMRCHSSHGGTGTVTVRVHVASSGRVVSATASSAPNAALGRCVAAEVAKARFRRAKQASTFSYPFLFR